MNANFRYGSLTVGGIDYPVPLFGGSVEIEIPATRMGDLVNQAVMSCLRYHYRRVDDSLMEALWSCAFLNELELVQEGWDISTLRIW